MKALFILSVLIIITVTFGPLGLIAAVILYGGL